MVDIDYRQLGSRIQRLREGMGVSQEVLAEQLDLTRQAIGQIEKGARKIDSLELAKLADFFSLTTDELLKFSLEERERPNRAQASGIHLDPVKFENLILYILEKCGGKPNIGETVLYKILYFIDFDSFENLGSPVTGMSYVKLQYGPVPRKKDYDAVIKNMKSAGKLNIFTHAYYGKMQCRYVALTQPDLSFFSAAEIDVIHKVINRLSDMNATEITEYVHGDVPWKITPDGNNIDYQAVFEREVPYASQEYGGLFRAASAQDILEELGPMSQEETDYYKNL